MDKKSIKEQAQSGLRRGLMWVFGIGWLALTGAGIAIVTTPPPPPPIVGWILLSIAALILVITMDRWKKIIAGLLAYGAINCFVSIFSGHVTSNFSVHVSRLEAIAATMFLIASAALCFRFINEDLHIVDRIALFILVFCIFLQAAKPQFEAFALAVALCGLIIAWLYDSLLRRNQHHRDPSDPHEFTI